LIILILTIYTCSGQAHIPTYILSWLVGVTNPVVYVLACPRYRRAVGETLRSFRKAKCGKENGHFGENQGEPLRIYI
jgi:hypothetical protein